MVFPSALVQSVGPYNLCRVKYVNIGSEEVTLQFVETVEILRGRLPHPFDPIKVCPPVDSCRGGKVQKLAQHFQQFALLDNSSSVHIPLLGEDLQLQHCRYLDSYLVIRK